MSTQFKSYGRCASGESIRETPTSLAEVQDLFEQAKTNGQKVTIRGGGHSFDGQAVQEGDNGTQMVIDAANFQDITFLPGNRVQLGAGVRWGDVLSQTLALGLIPAVMQTGSQATAGGTLGGDCLSRFSCALGKESEWIESFVLVPPDGGPLPCSRTQNADVFAAAVGGHGYLGFVSDIVYQLIPIGRGHCAHTQVDTYEKLEDLVADLIPKSKTAKKSAASYLSAARTARDTRIVTNADPVRPMATVGSSVTALSSVVFESFGHKMKGGIFKSWYAPPHTPKLPHCPLYHDLASDARYHSELASRNDFENRVIHEALFTLMKLGFNRFDDDLHEFTFFMDGNTYAKGRFEQEHPGKPFPIVQQTYVLPEAATVGFVGTMVQALHDADLTPTEMDILYVLKDDCYLSATYDQDGFAVSVAFENYSTACPPDSVQEFLKAMSVVCADNNGRIHLVKNIYADVDVSKYMLRSSLAQFTDVKGRLDGSHVLWNPFLERVTGIQRR
jgi:decaprenylphospho-beta-D-ribofuranose 2-oxidase